MIKNIVFTMDKSNMQCISSPSTIHLPPYTVPHTFMPL